MMPHPSPWVGYRLPSPYVGAAADWAAVSDRKAKADEAKKQSDKALGLALGSHAGYDSALAANAYAADQFEKLRALTAVQYGIALADPGANSPQTTATILAYHDDAKARLVYLGLERQQILDDQAAHAGGGGAATFLNPATIPAAPGPAYDPGGGDPFFADVSKSYQTAVGKWKYASDLATAALAAHHSQQAALDALNDAITWWTKVQTDANTLQAITLGQPDKQAKLSTYANIAADRIAQAGKVKQALVDDLAAHGPGGSEPPPGSPASELSHRIGTVFLVIGLGAAAVAILAPAAAVALYRKVTR